MELTEDDVLHILKLIDESKFDYFQLEVGELKITVSKGEPIPLAGTSPQQISTNAAPSPAPAAAKPSPVPASAPAVAKSAAVPPHSELGASLQARESLRVHAGVECSLLIDPRRT